MGRMDFCAAFSPTQPTSRSKCDIIGIVSHRIRATDGVSQSGASTLFGHVSTARNDRPLDSETQSDFKAPLGPLMQGLSLRSRHLMASLLAVVVTHGPLTRFDIGSVETHQARRGCSKEGRRVLAQWWLGNKGKRQNTLWCPEERKKHKNKTDHCLLFTKGFFLAASSRCRHNRCI